MGVRVKGYSFPLPAKRWNDTETVAVGDRGFWFWKDGLSSR
jgi:hypothetical protein